MSRQFRYPYTEKYMVKLVKQSVPFWDELQSLTPVPLREVVGTLWFGDPTVHTSEGNIKEAEAALQANKVPFTKLKAAEIEKQYHFRNLPPTYAGLFQPDGASINLKATLRTLYDWNKESPWVTLLEEAPASRIVQKGKTFEVTTPMGTFVTEKLVIVPGPYVDNVIKMLGFTIGAQYWNLTSAYYRKTRPGMQYPTWFVFQDPVKQNGNEFYGFPEVSWDHPGYVRVASDFVIQPLASPEQRVSIPNQQELAYTASWVKNHMTGLDPTPEFTSTCLISLTTLKNKEMLLDFAPKYVLNYNNVVICATGWVGKFIPLLGRILSDLALEGHTRFDISHFKTGSTYFKALAAPKVKPTP